MSYSGVGGTSSDWGFRKLTALWISCCEGFHVALKHSSYTGESLVKTALQIDWMNSVQSIQAVRPLFLILLLFVMFSVAFWRMCTNIRLKKNGVTCMNHAVGQETNQGERHEQEQAAFDGLYLGATNLQGAGCVRSCSTSSVLVKRTDKNIFGECGALENLQNTHRDAHRDTHTHAPPLPPTRPTQRQCSYHYLPHHNTHSS